MGWVSPTSFTDGSGNWLTETNIYDENVGTYGHQPDVGTTSWSDWIELNIGAIACTKIRFDSASTVNITDVEIELFYDAGWQALYNGVFANHTWVEKAIGGTETVTAAQFRFYNASAVSAYTVALYEMDFYTPFAYMESSIAGDGTLAAPLTLMRYMASSIAGDGALTADSIKLVNKIWPKFILEIHDSSGNLISILENAYDIRWVQELNKAHQLGFSMPIDDPKRADILLTNEIWLRDYRSAVVQRKFILSSTVEQRK